MAKINACDGNGTPIPDDAPTTGPFGRQYCDELRPVAEKYLEDLNALHTRVAEAFKLELADLRASYADKLQSLPDTPDVG